MRTTIKALRAFGLVAGAATLAIPGAGAAKAQGFHIDAPNVHVRVGHPHHWYYRHRGYGAYAADPGHPYGYNYDYGDWRCGVPNYTVQGGVCKPYRGY
jgi:hypothetical protein